MPAKSTVKKSASRPAPADDRGPVEEATDAAAKVEPAPVEPADAVQPEPLNRAERRAARRKGGAQPPAALPPGKVRRGTQVPAPRQWANRRRSG